MAQPRRTMVRRTDPPRSCSATRTARVGTATGATSREGRARAGPGREGRSKIGNRDRAITMPMPAIRASTTPIAQGITGAPALPPAVARCAPSVGTPRGRPPPPSRTTRPAGRLWAAAACGLRASRKRTNQRGNGQPGAVDRLALSRGVQRGSVRPRAGTPTTCAEATQVRAADLARHPGALR